MATSFEKSYPNITRWVTLQGWIELGQDEYSSSLIRVLDEGGVVWEGSAHYRTLDKARILRGRRSLYRDRATVYSIASHEQSAGHAMSGAIGRTLP